MTEHTPIFGIDLGTTYSCIAYVDEFGRPVVVPNAEGEYTTPSVVLFEGQERIVGTAAKESAVVYPDRVVEMIKRQMGQPGYIFPYDGKNHTAEEISSYILRKLVRDAERYLNMEIKDVVITCPAYFGTEEREATAHAGEVANLNVRSIINEPTAAAIAYGMHEDQDQTILVYDLGGGTFDITMIEIQSGDITVISTGGDHFLGGRNWDEILVRYLAEAWQQETGSLDDPMDSPETLQDLFTRAESAKRTLSNRESVNVSIAHAGERAAVKLTREKFDELTENLLERTIKLTQDMLDQAAQKEHTLYDQFLLVGGATKMPQVTQRVEQEFGITPQIFDPDQAVAKGAAIYGQKLEIEEEIKIRISSLTGQAMEEISSQTVAPDVVEQATAEVADEMGLRIGTVRHYNNMKIVNVTSRSFGVIALKHGTKAGEFVEIVSNLIKINDQVPAQVTQRFGTVEENQQSAEIQIVEDLSNDDEVDPQITEEIGTASLNLPPGLPINSPIEITFELDEQGRLHSTALELSSGNIVEVDIQTSRVISKEELEEAMARSGQLVVS
jgi:molecular chaperone DnaK